MAWAFLPEATKNRRASIHSRPINLKLWRFFE